MIPRYLVGVISFGPLEYSQLNTRVFVFLHQHQVPQGSIGKLECFLNKLSLKSKNVFYKSTRGTE